MTTGHIPAHDHLNPHLGRPLPAANAAAFPAGRLGKFDMK